MTNYIVLESKAVAEDESPIEKAVLSIREVCMSHVYETFESFIARRPGAFDMVDATTYSDGFSCRYTLITEAEYLENV
jgi:hypothetical protein